MEQINIRVTKVDKKIIETFANIKGVSTAEFVKQSVFKEISPERIDLAYQLLQEGKIGRKQALILSGLTFHEFMVEWSKRGIRLEASDELIDYQMDLLSKIDFNQYIKPDLITSKKG